MFKGNGECEADRECEAREAAGDYVLAVVADNESLIDDALDRVDPALLMSSVLDIALRAVVAPARERGLTVEQAMRSLVAG